MAKAKQQSAGLEQGADEDVLHLGQLSPDPANARRHNPRNVGMIADALREVGAARSIVIDEDGRILAGNATVEAAADAGIERVRVVEADGETIIAVRRRGLTPEQKKRLAYYDNRAAELADWDPARLLADAGEGLDLSFAFYPEELRALLVDLPVFDDEAAMGRSTRPWNPAAVAIISFGRWRALVDADMVDRAVERLRAAYGDDDQVALVRLCEAINEGLLGS